MLDFTRKYSLSKTLRFELRPVGETTEKLDDFKNQAIRNIVAQDKKRAEDYKQIKKIIDDYHRDFIENVLSREILTDNDVQTAFDSYIRFKGSKDVQIKKDYLAIQKKLRSNIANVFEKQAKECVLFEKELINEQGSEKNKIKPILWQWQKRRLESKKINQEEFDQSEKLIQNFNKFYTYFTGFNENRRNIYSAEEKSTAISYRIVHDNMVKHFNNCLNFDVIKQNHRDLYETLKTYKDIFTPTAFHSCLSQSQINEYNEKVGHRSDSINAKGVNQLINEYRQKNKVEHRKLPMMTILYKQILSDKANSFKIDAFEDDKQLLDAVKDFYEVIMPDLQELRKCFNEYLKGNSLDDIYIKNDVSITNISQDICGNWSLINSALEKYADGKLKLNKNKRKKWLEQDVFAISIIQSAIDSYLDDLEDKTVSKTIKDYFKAFESKDVSFFVNIEESYNQARSVLLGENLEKDKEAKVQKIKSLLDSIMAVLHFIKPLSLIKDGKAIEVSPKNTSFYDSFNQLYDNLSIVIGLYNKTRNYVTQKPYKTDKFKINFENSTLLDGWDVNKETENTSILLFKDGRYYLGIMSKNSNAIFNYRNGQDDSDKKQEEKKQLRQQIIAGITDDYYEKMIYKLLPDPSKMLPKVIFGERNIEYYNPSDEILKIKQQGIYKKDAENKSAMHQWIDFLKKSITKHPEWNEYFAFKFSPTKTYEDCSQFYKEVANQGYHLSFDKIKADYVNEKIANGQLYLFEIYSKDFSKFSKGTPNLHTSYWKLLFSKENLDDLILKLNGQAEVFFRPGSLKKSDTTIHKASKPINNKNPLNPKTHSTFEYDIIKNKRFTQDKFFFHCPITLNFNSSSVSGFNGLVNQYLRDNLKDINIIGIDRGERHLLYYTVINQKGEILKQDSLNTITNSMFSDGREIKKTTNYHQLLDTREKERDAARKSWSSIENIKGLKSGYLSHIVHQLAKLMVDNNAIVVLEDLNFGFKRGRFKVEKQVYQKFERALIDKLNYIVFKEASVGKAGHYLNAYQLTAPFESFQKLGKQSGFLFYVTSDYTSKIDPVTGFVNRLDTSYQNVKKSKEFFGKFDSIHFNCEKAYFEFSFNYVNFQPDKSGSKKDWTVCTAGKNRYRYDRQNKETICYDVTAQLKELFKDNQIEYESGCDLVNQIVNMEEAKFFKSLFLYLGLTLQLRHSYKNGDEQEDFILSPVANINGEFFDSRYAMEGQPKDADANGAFNIARKGWMALNQIQKDGMPSAIRNVDWFDFVQKKQA